MIRIVASTIVERPMLFRDKEHLIKQHIHELPNIIRSFRNAIVTVSRESKWCKMALLRKGVPVEIFALIQPYLITKGSHAFYPNVARDQCVAPHKYFLIESKLYRMELAYEKSMWSIHDYIMNGYVFREYNKYWELRKFNNYEKRIDFIHYVLMVRYFITEDAYSLSVYEIEDMLRYWF
jgi:hypothetical protein